MLISRIARSLRKNFPYTTKTAISGFEKYPRLLRAEISRSIKANGPITVAEFIKMVNTHPKYGYYAYKDVIGTLGDFITAPEISQLFGETVAIFLIHTLQSHFSDTQKPIRIIELGPGKGTFMFDILRTLERFDLISSRIKTCTLVEKSISLQKIQEDLLCTNFPAIQFTWDQTIDKVFSSPPDSGLLNICISNEFFDALPIHLFQKDLTTGWNEILIDALDLGDDIAFRFVKSNGPTAPLKFLMVEQKYPHIQSGKVIQVCPEASRISQIISQNLQRSGGIFATIDYGGMGDPENSLRAIKGHRQLTTPLEDVGESDLSSNVDFSALSNEFSPNNFVRIGPLAQNEFLLKYGISERFNSLMMQNGGRPDLIETLRGGAERLLDPNQMGTVYKAFAAITK